MDRSDLEKSYTKDLGGTLNAIDTQAAQAAFTPDAGERKDFIRPLVSGGQPGENVGGGDGSMVTATPSASGTGAMVVDPVAGYRAVEHDE